jgi:hypothetical protein
MEPNYEQSTAPLAEPLNGIETPVSTRSEKVLKVSPEVLLGQTQSTPTPSNPTSSALPLPLDSSATNQPTTITGATLSGLADDDTDLIEKDWVLKAKAIVEHTKEDPHQQKSEISKFKADYLKKRYNKDIKVSSES